MLCTARADDAARRRFAGVAIEVRQPVLAIADIRQKAQLASPLDSPSQLALMTPTAAGHAGGSDLALLRELAADSAEVLVVDDVDLVPAVRARLTPAGTGRAFPITAAARATGLLPIARFTCHLLRCPLVANKVPAELGLRGVYRAKSRSTARRASGIRFRAGPALHSPGAGSARPESQCAGDRSRSDPVSGLS